jgi:hypothetical protein
MSCDCGALKGWRFLVTYITQLLMLFEAPAAAPSVREVIGCNHV